MNKSLFAKPICAQRLARVPQKGLSPLSVKQFITFLIALAAMTVSTTSAWGEAKDIRYLTYSGGAITESIYPVYATQLTFTSDNLVGWYYVEGNVTISRTVKLGGHTTIILCDGATLTINTPPNRDGIDLNGHDLTICAQSSGSHAGKLTINSGYEGFAGDGNGNVTINGGIISITSTSGNGIYCNNFTVNGGKVDIIATAANKYGIYTKGAVTIKGGMVSATGSSIGIKSVNAVTINGGQVSVTGGSFGIHSTGSIKLGWTNAEDYIECSKYIWLPYCVNGKEFNISGGGTFGNSAGVDISDLAGKRLTPKTTTASYTVSLGTGITGGTVEVDKTKAFENERVAVNVTPETGKILASLTYNDGTNTYTIGTNSTDIKRQANDYVITMPAANVTVNATFVTPVAQIGDTQYATLQAALDAVGSGETTITILEDISEAGTSRGDWSDPNLIFLLNNHTVSFDAITGVANLTITGPGTLNCNQITNNNGDNNQTMTFDGCNVVCEGTSNCFSWMANHVVLTNGANVEWKNAVGLGFGSTNFTFEIDKTGTGGSVLKLTDCSIGNSYSQEAHVKAQLDPYVHPDDVDLVVDGYTKNNLTLKKRAHKVTVESGTAWIGPTESLTQVTSTTEVRCNSTVTIVASDVSGKQFSHWSTTSTGVTFASSTASTTTFTMPDNAVEVTANYTEGLLLVNNLSNATVQFYDGVATFNPADPTTFAPADYVPAGEPGANEIYAIDNSDGQDHYIIMHIVPHKGDIADPDDPDYWTNERLLSVLDGPATASETAQPLMLRVDDYDANHDPTDPDMKPRHDGAGWYYYTLPATHNVASGFTNSTLQGLTAPVFEMENVSLTQNLETGVVTLSRTTDTWTAELTYDRLHWPFTGTIDDTDKPKLKKIVMKYGGSPLITLDSTPASESASDVAQAAAAAAEIAAQIRHNYPYPVSQLEWNQQQIGNADAYGWFLGTNHSTDSYFWIDMPFTPLDPTEATYPAGTANNPWLIQSGADLSMLAKCVNVAAYTFNGETLKMGLNGKTYDMSGSDFEPIGIDGNLPFCGTLLGNGSTIKNISYVFAGPSAVSDETQYGIGFIGNLGDPGEPRRSGNVDNIKLENCSFSSSDGDIGYVGSIAGAANRGSVRKCYVIGGNVSAPKPGSYAGAIVGKLGAATLTNNYYDYATTATLNGSTASGYTKRGICTETISADPSTTPSTYDWNDFTTNDGAMLWVKKATVPAVNANGSKVEFNEVTKGTDRYDMAGDDFYYAVGQSVTLSVTTGTSTDGDIRTFYDELTALTVSDGTTDTDIKDALSFTMPGAEAEVAATFTPSDWFTINTVNYNAADPRYNWMTFYHEWTMKDPTSDNNVAGKFVVTNYDDPTAAVEVKTITAVDPTAGTYTSAAINGSYSGVPTLFHYADNNNGALPQKLKFTPDFNIELNQTADRRFMGTATALALSASAKCYILNNAGDFILAYVTPTDNTIAAHRCYVDLSGDNSNQARLISSGDATGIDSMVNGQGTMDNLDGDWFSLDGRRLNGQPTRKGIYIHHGKKTVIK